MSTGITGLWIDKAADRQLSWYAPSLISGRKGLVCCLWEGILIIRWHTHTHTSLFCLKSPPISFHLILTVNCLKAVLWAGPVIKSQALVVGVEGADRQTGQAGFSWSLPLSPLSVSLSVLIAAADLSFPRGFCERTEMWCCYSLTSCGEVCLWRPCSILLLWSPPHHLLLFFLNRKTPGARRCVTAVSGMLGGHCNHYPGLHLHLRRSEVGPRISYCTSGRGAESKRVHHS